MIVKDLIYPFLTIILLLLFHQTSRHYVACVQKQYLLLQTDRHYVAFGMVCIVSFTLAPDERPVCSIAEMTRAISSVRSDLLPHYQWSLLFCINYKTNIGLITIPIKTI